MQNHRSWDEVDQASLESFPASDPPAWGSSHAVACEATAVPEEVGGTPERSWAGWALRDGKTWALAGAGVLALAGGAVLIVRWLRA